MAVIQGKVRRKILEDLTRESRLSSPLLRQLRDEFDQSEAIDPGGIGRLYEGDLAQDRDRQRASGSYFTPDYLVDFVVQHTLGPLVEGLSANEIFELRILDPSCGAGAILLGALRFLESHCESIGCTPGSQLRAELSQCLVGVDIDANAIALSRAAISMAVVGKESALASIDEKSTLVHGDALCPETHFGQVHAIVGNPPWGQKGLKLSKRKRARYKELFACAKGSWDPFKLFVERCHQLLAEGGRWGLVLPDIVLLKNLQEVRDVILQGSSMDEIAHCGRVFKGANIDAVAIVAERKSDSGLSETGIHKSRIRVWPKLSSRWQEGNELVHRQEQEVFGQLPGHKFNLYLHGKALALYRRLQPLQRLGSWFEMHEGVHTGNCRKKLFRTECHSHWCKKVIIGRSEFSAYRLEWGGAWLDTEEGVVQKDRGDYANLGRKEWHQAGKIVVRRTGDRVIAAYDQEGYYVSNNLFVLNDTVALSSREKERRGQAIVALLNSRFMTWYFRAVQPRKGRLFAELKLVHLRDFPLPEADRWTEIEATLAKLAVSARHSNDGNCAEEINALVESAFEVSPQELEIIKLSL